MTLAMYAARWLKRLPHRVCPRTVDAYAQSLKRHIVPRFGTQELSSITRREVRAWLVSLLSDGKAANTVASLLTCLQALYTAALDDELVEASPAHGAGRNLYTRKLRPRRLEAGALDALLTEVQKGPVWSTLLIGVYVRTGLRSAEGLGLAVGDVQGRRLLVRRQWQYRQHRVLPYTKGGGFRWVDLSPMAACLLEQMEGRARGGWLSTVDGKYPPAASGLQHYLRRCARRAGLPPGLRIHDLRHTYACRLLESGAPLDYVRAQLGHADVQTTNRYVLGAQPPPRLDFADRLDTGLTDVALRRPVHGFDARPQLRLVRRRASGER